jgi:HlyD family secretion protein
MQVEANIDEADIGKVKEGQRVSFTVDAFSDLNFEGKVIQIRLNPTTVSNVVTYTVIVQAPNPDRKLMPGMTASITIYVNEARNVLTVSSKALHFTPDQSTLTAYFESLRKKDKLPEPPKDTNLPAEGKDQPMTPADSAGTMVWVKDGVNIHPVKVEVGIDDDLNAQITQGLKEGDEVVISMTASGNSTATAASGGSPFMPKPPSRSSSKTAK